MELGLIRKIDIDHEMQQSYLDYAMSVIVARALPDARDGLKPVQRRILYAMYDMGLRPDSAYKKSARIVGEVLGKYHPHGDMAVYEAMARMAQDFSMRYVLVDGQGNFGSVDGDPPAAMRYTEARLTPVAMDMLNQIDKNTVDFVANFDDTLKEPLVLPAAIPNLLVNGATGIAVGMATNIPPHNLGEVVDALVFMLQEWEHLDDIAVDRLMGFIQGPDFPTGGVIIQDPQGDALTSAYGSGRGRVIVQARAHLEEMGRGKNRIIVTELPYLTNKAGLIERIAELVREGELEGVADLRDESDRQGMRIVIELSKAAEADSVLRELYRRTPMQNTFSINLLALVDGEPRLLSLKQALRVYVEHRLMVIRRRSEYDLERARQRAHILEGLRVALQHLDEVISLIRTAPDVDAARQRLTKRFRLSEVQANAILEMQLRRLAALERKKIELEYKETIALIKELEGLLRSPRKMRQVAIDELLAVKQAYGDRRRTQIVRLKEGVSATALLTTTDLTPEQIVWVGATEDGHIARTAGEDMPKMSGRDAPSWLVRTTTHQVLYLVSDRGRAAAIPVHAVPEAEDFTQGAAFASISPLDGSEPLAAIFALPAAHTRESEGRFVMTVTRGGMVKKTAVGELPGPSAQSFWLAKVNEGDTLGWVLLTDGKTDILLATAQGMAIRFSEEDVRPMGLVAAGVGGIKLGVGDEVIGAAALSHAGQVFFLASDGKAKRVEIKEFPRQGRYGQGVIVWKLVRGVRLAGILAGKAGTRGTILFVRSAARVVRLEEAAPRSRSAAGARLLELKPGDAPLEVVAIWDAFGPWGGASSEVVKASARKAGGTGRSRTKADGARIRAGKSGQAKLTPKSEDTTAEHGQPGSFSAVIPEDGKKARRPTQNANKAGQGKAAKPAAQRRSKSTSSDQSRRAGNGRKKAVASGAGGQTASGEGRGEESSAAITARKPPEVKPAATAVQKPKKRQGPAVAAKKSTKTLAKDETSSPAGPPAEEERTGGKSGSKAKPPAKPRAKGAGKTEGT